MQAEIRTYGLWGPVLVNWLVLTDYAFTYTRQSPVPKALSSCRHTIRA